MLQEQNSQKKITPFQQESSRKFEVRGIQKAQELKEQNINEQNQQIDWRTRRLIYILFCMMQMILNYDTGVIPASIIKIESEMKINYKQIALIGTFVYLGLCLATPFVSIILQKRSPAKILAVMQFVNSLFCFIFASSYRLSIIYISRLGMGFTQAFCVCYAPVWVNEFAPIKNQTKWMGLMQCCAAIGIMLGYTVAGCLINFYDTDDVSIWRYAIWLQGICSIPLVLAILCISPEHINISGGLLSSGQKPDIQHSIRIDSIQPKDFKSVDSQVIILLKNKIFICITLALCSIYFASTGVQYWITAYLIVCLQSDPILVLIGFSITAITSPLLGTIVGSYIADQFGGYKNENQPRAIQLCVLFGMLGFIIAIPTGFANSIYYVLPLLWLLFFFGGCLVPTATGISINSIQKEYQSTSSSLSQLIFGIGGYFLAPVASAFIMDSFEDTKEGLTWGFRFILYSTVIALIFGLIAFFVTQKNYNSEERDKVVELEAMSVNEVKF